MFRYLSVFPLFMLLAACQSSPIQQDYDPNRSYTQYRSWAWAEPAVSYAPADPRLQSDLTTQRIREAVAGQLDVRGLRPAVAGTEPDLTVRAHLVVENRQDQVTTSYGGYWGGYWRGGWGGPGYYETRTVDYRVGTLQIDLFDAQDNQLVWRGSASEVLRDGEQTPAERSRKMHELAAKVLSRFPPQ